MSMKKLLLSGLALTIGVAAAMAVPATPGVKKTLTLKDGKSFIQKMIHILLFKTRK